MLAWVLALRDELQAREPARAAEFEGELAARPASVLVQLSHTEAIRQGNLLDSIFREDEVWLEEPLGRGSRVLFAFGGHVLVDPDDTFLLTLAQRHRKTCSSPDYQRCDDPDGSPVGHG